MGQYYRPSFLFENWKNRKQPVEFTIESWSWDNGAKLMESAWVGNNIWMAIEWLLSGKLYGRTFATIGDYADNKCTKAYPNICVRIRNVEYFSKNNSTEAIHGLINLIGHANYNKLIKEGDCFFDNIPTLTEYIDGMNAISYLYGLNIYNKASDAWEKKSKEFKSILSSIPKSEDIPYFKYAVNFDKKEYVIIPEFKEKKWIIHPLPLLCSDGNGRGGGDYHGTDIEYVGKWAYDHIGTTNKKPDKSFKQIKPKFKESWD